MADKATTKMSVTVDNDLHAKIKTLADKDGRSMTGYIVALLRAHVARKAVP